MHWFDEFSKAAAGHRPSRAAMLEGMASIVAGAAVAPFVVSSRAAVASPKLDSHVAPGAKGASAAAIRRERFRLPSTLQRGPCAFTFGKNNTLSFTAHSSSLQLTLHHETTREDGSKKGSIAFSGHTVVEITQSGESIVRFESHFDRWDPAATKSPDGKLSYRYGSKIRGASNVNIDIKGGMLAGKIDGRDLVPFTLAGGAPSVVRLSDGRSPVIDSDQTLRDALSGLTAAVKRGLSTCGDRPRLERTSERRPIFELALRTFDVAQAASGYIPGTPTLQNNGSFLDEPNTPNCRNATVSALLTAVECASLGVVGLIFCPPCSAAAYVACYTGYGTALLAMEAPGQACNQVSCGQDNPGPTSCDNGFTCCGSKDCCPTGYYCGQNGYCCATGEISCGLDYNSATCCGANTICGPTQGDYTTCVLCPEGQTAKNGQCCYSFCGDECCQSAQATCNQSTLKCQYPTFGTPAPQPTTHSIARCTKISGTVTCQASNADGSYTDVCCKPGIQCCAGQCCPPGQTCGGVGAAHGCGIWIK